jgi:ligand-binding SRPBCC domain-containing protein
MKAFTVQADLWLPAPREQVFQYFASAHNLETITPDWLRFKVLTPDPIQMGPGALIDYRLRIHGIPFRWRTEITRWNPPDDFEDVQRRGPFALWRHTHTFYERHGGTLCTDHIRYRPPGGALVDWLFVTRYIEQIFQHRRKRLTEIFAAEKSDVRQ